MAVGVDRVRELVEREDGEGGVGAAKSGLVSGGFNSLRLQGARPRGRASWPLSSPWMEVMVVVVELGWGGQACG